MAKRKGYKLSQPPVNKYFRVAKKAIDGAAYAAGAVAAQKMFSNTMTQTQTNNPSDNGITIQKDAILQYKKKRMPKYKRRRWVKFIRKVEAATRDEGTQTIVFNDRGLRTGSGANSQQWGIVHLYGNCGIDAVSDEEVGKRDLDRIKTEIGNPNTQKIKFKSAVLDVTFQAINSTSGFAQPVEVDVYHIVYRKTPSGLGRDSFL